MAEKKYNDTWKLRKRDKFCIDCKFWSGFGETDDKGECRRYAPRPYALLYGGENPTNLYDGENPTNTCWDLARWNRTKPVDWCGEFEQSAKAKQEEDEIKAENP